MSITREDIIAFAQKRYGQRWMAALARDTRYSNLRRIANGIGRSPGDEADGIGGREVDTAAAVRGDGPDGCQV